MTTHFILIDFENVQPKDLGLLTGCPFKIKVFVGANQKVPLEMARTLQAFGPDAEYIQIDGNGRNALDFHIAYYIGRMTAQTADAHFHVISKDAGFDPLIKHLKGKGVLANRSVTIADIPFSKSDDPLTTGPQVDAAITHLVRLKAAKPRTQKTLMGTLHALFKKELTEKQLAGIFGSLCKRGVVKIDGTKISYVMPTSL